MKRLGIGLLVLLCCLSGVLFPNESYFGPQAARAASDTELQDIKDQWSSSAHALADVNCSSCHLEEKTKKFVAQPTQESCKTCHEHAVDTFLLGKHGIRILEGQSPLTPAIAHLPMQADAQDRVMNCNTCHDVHSVNTRKAAVDSCLSCHNDTHSQNYEKSKHAQLWQKEGAVPRPTAQSISCATCHLPRHDIGTKSKPQVVVNHNNTYTLLPRDRMVKEACMNCHGMEYAYNSIFDDELVASNFARPPTQELQTLEMIRALETKRSGN